MRLPIPPFLIFLTFFLSLVQGSSFGTSKHHQLLRTNHTLGEELQTNFGPGEILIALATMIFLIAVLLRFARRCHKALDIRLALDDPLRSFSKDPQAIPLLLGDPKGGSSGSLLPSELEPAGVLGPKATRGALSCLLRGLLLWRIPGTQISLGFSLLALLFAGLNLVALFFGEGANFMVKTGSLSAANALLLAIPATRNSILVLFLGLPFDRMIMVHRWLGYWTVALNSVHASLTLIDWALAGNNLVEWVFEDRWSMYGLIAWAIGLILFASSLSYFRRRHFEWFYALHFLFPAYFVLGALHSNTFLPYALAAATLYGLDRLLRFLLGLRSAKASLSVKGVPGAGPDAQLIRVTFPKNPLAGCLLRAPSPGQYVFANFPSLSFLQWHPFSITSAPDDEMQELHIRALGDLTSQLLLRAQGPEGSFLRIRVDGPYGDLNLNLRRFPSLVLVSGGIGFAPVLGMLKDLYRAGGVGPTHVIKRVSLLWVIRSPAQVTWFQEELAAFAQRAGVEGSPALQADIFITMDEAFPQAQPIQTSRAKVLFHPGRPNFGTYLRTSLSPKEANLVFACGPEQMVNTLWDECSAYSRKGTHIDFHREVFEF